MRYKSIDVLRGLMMIVISIDHFGGWFFQFTYQSLGFISGIEGFLFLSGLLYGIVYSKYLDTSRYFLFKKTYNRAFLIYKYHLLTITFFLLVVLLKEYLKFSSITLPLNLQKFILGAFFLHNPFCLDVLPIYIIFIIFSPLALIALKNNKFTLVITVSILLWIIGQFEIPYYKYLPEGNHLGSFNLFSYQLLFMIGVIMGYYKKNDQLQFRFPNYLIFISIILFITFFILRHIPEATLKIPEYLTSKTRLTIFRLLNFSIVTYLIYWLISKKKFIQSKYLEFLGKHSLQVFFYSLLVITMLPFLHAYISTESTILYAFLSIIFVFSLFIPAWLHLKYIEIKINK